MSGNATEDKVNRKMHELFMQVLKNRDLSRAGDLFSVPDTVIVNDLTNVVRKLLNFTQYCCHLYFTTEKKNSKKNFICWYVIGV